MSYFPPIISQPTLIHCESETAVHLTNTSLPSPWLAGLDLQSFPGPSFGEKVAQAAHALGVDILSPSAESYVTPSPDPKMSGYETFTTREMVREARRLGLGVIVWSVRNICPVYLDVY